MHPANFWKQKKEYEFWGSRRFVGIAAAVMAACAFLFWVSLMPCLIENGYSNFVCTLSVVGFIFSFVGLGMVGVMQWRLKVLINENPKMADIPKWITEFGEKDALHYYYFGEGPTTEQREFMYRVLSRVGRLANEDAGSYIRTLRSVELCRKDDPRRDSLTDFRDELLARKNMSEERLRRVWDLFVGFGFKPDGKDMDAFREYLADLPV